jgi:hypothetical protein
MEEERMIRGELFQAVVRITLMCMEAREKQKRRQQ